jgi:hypothetical protein
MIEGRAAPRYRVNKLGWMVHSGDKIICTVRDLSTTGPSMEISDPNTGPAKFRLAMG